MANDDSDLDAGGPPPPVDASSRTTPEHALLGVCALCHQPLTRPAAAGGCLRCIVNFVALGEDAVSDRVSGHEEVRRYSHFEIMLEADGTLAELGHGAMGTTYRAVDTVLQSSVALKVIGRNVADTPAVRARFLREARTAARLRHPNAASVFHYGEQEGECFYVMELVGGETLEECVRRDGPLPAQTVLEIGEQVARALEAAETQGLVHRDLKPSNLMLVNGRDGASKPGEALFVKVIDFGLAKAVSSDAAAGENDTRHGFVGTPAYASPEQFAGSGADSRVDTRSDFYSLGVTLWFLLCGRTPFHGHSLGEIHGQQVNQALPLDQLTARRVPAPTVTLLRSLLAIDPGHRPQNSRELLEAIYHCQGNGSRSRSWKLIGPLLAIALLILMVLVAIITRNAWIDPRSAPPASTADRSVAVLSFENRSPDEDVAFFTAGMQDGITGELARIAQLKVVRPGTGNLDYPSGQRDLAKIGHELGVSHLVEGTVRRENDQIQVMVILTDIHDKSRDWSKTYTGRLSDVFTIQRNVTREIADHMRATLSGGELTALNQPPTMDPVAYDLYLQVHQDQDEAGGVASTLAADKRKIALLQQALARDPNFALAYCELAKAHDDLQFYSYGASLEDRAVDHRSLAEAALQQARRLRPDAGEMHLAEAHHFLQVNHDVEQAEIEVQHARRSLPNSAEVEFMEGRIARRQNRWGDAVRSLERAATLEPSNIEVNDLLGDTYGALRQYDDYARVARRLAALVPSTGGTDLLFSLAMMTAQGRADVAPIRQALAALTGSEETADEYRESYGLLLVLCDHDADAITNHLARYQQDQFIIRGEAFPRSWYEALAARMKGDEVKAQEAFVRARLAAEKLVLANVTDGRPLSFLALVDAALGRNDEAVREARRACELMQPYEKYALEASGVRSNLAAVYAWTGQPDLAVAELSQLLGQPAGASSNGFSLGQATYGDLCLDPVWDQLRDDPRFTALVKKLAPKPIR